ncbi:MULTISPECIES: hypothetical protein [unclassified Burkholderia]|uniref:hypothetical protein n=1 Tax=unclassified Burkholderia TaxID=2613784 RepID=UPI000A5E8B46|nr:MULTISPECIES: hypothetical protein [unclassified Burkholderia]
MLPVSAPSRNSAPAFNSTERLAQSSLLVTGRSIVAYSIQSDIVDIACYPDRFPEVARMAPQLSVDEEMHVKMTLPGDLGRVADWISKSGKSGEKQRQLTCAAAERLRIATVQNSSSELALLIARERVIRGAPCGRVAAEHGIAFEISPGTMYDYLEHSVLDRESAALRSVLNGKPCNDVAEKHDVRSVHARGRLELESIVKNGRILAMQGASRDAIIARLGVSTSDGKEQVDYVLSKFGPRA